MRERKTEEVSKDDKAKVEDESQRKSARFAAKPAPAKPESKPKEALEKKGEKVSKGKRGQLMLEGWENGDTQTDRAPRAESAQGAR